jgi:hypothetical protein
LVEKRQNKSGARQCQPAFYFVSKIWAGLSKRLSSFVLHFLTQPYLHPINELDFQLSNRNNE